MSPRRAPALAWRLGAAVAVVLGCLAGAPAALAAGPEQWAAPPDGLDGRSLALRAENMMRSSRTYLVARMTVSSPRLPAPRVVAFRNWDDRVGKRSFIRIDRPPKDDGTTFLKLHPNLWMYVPRVERTVRIPPSMMLQSWMGSDFTNDDLVRESSEIDDYDHTLLGTDPEVEHLAGRSAHVVEYRPHEDAPVVWGRILAWLDVERGAPLRQEFFDEDGEKLRVLLFSDLRKVDERWVPHRWELVPLDKPGHGTVIEIDSIRFDTDFDESVFTRRNLVRASERR
ncbi:MAG: outer membrane lipoprotein-sorting protein [Myxococcota bacterium]